ncbi:MAG: hypothetical protein HY719_11285 [Planctomycetes bacterium]|nr:hypothetical protein [Planctomycetota bacterium]
MAEQDYLNVAVTKRAAILQVVGRWTLDQEGAFRAVCNELMPREKDPEVLDREEEAEIDALFAKRAPRREEFEVLDFLVDLSRCERIGPDFANSLAAVARSRVDHLSKRVNLLVVNGDDSMIDLLEEARLDRCVEERPLRVPRLHWERVESGPDRRDVTDSIEDALAHLWESYRANREEFPDFLDDVEDLLLGG